MSDIATALPPLVKIAGIVSEIIPAPAANRSGKVVLEDGKRLGAFADKLAKLHQGESYEFSCARRVVDGVVYHDVKMFRLTTPPSPPPTNFVQTPRPATPTNNRKLMETQNGNGNGWYRPTHPRDAERMWVCSTLNAFIQTGRIDNDVAALTDAVNKLRQVWRDTFGLDDQ